MLLSDLATHSQSAKELHGLASNAVADTWDKNRNFQDQPPIQCCVLYARVLVM